MYEGRQVFEDKTLVCKNCGNEFAFTAGEQAFYDSKGLTHEPQMCRQCRNNREKSVSKERELFVAVCASCGKEAKVPFKPRDGRPVYCGDCFAKMREE